MIDELAISVQLKCDRGAAIAGPSGAARPEYRSWTGQPMTVLVRGGMYEAVGRWRALSWMGFRCGWGDSRVFSHR